MPLVTDQLKVLRRQVGDKPSDDDLDAIYERVGSLTETAREVLEIRLANLVANPASFSVPGEYSQDTKANMDLLNKRLSSLGDLDNEDPTDDGSLSTVVIHHPQRTRIR